MKSNDRLEYLLQLLNEDKNDDFVIYALAKEYEKLGQVEASDRMFQQLLEINQDYLATYYHYGKLCEQLGKIEEAKNLYTMGIQKAKLQNDHHALSELNSALENLLDT
ncbi:MAG TPA: tetratricopeptide repeat protein [Saprospiraceae bacterium]|nr:tetratricopeptide repeat protein [Saprospiraceae bacterium]